MAAVTLDFKEQPRRFLKHFLDSSQETDRFATVGRAMTELVRWEREAIPPAREILEINLQLIVAAWFPSNRLDWMTCEVLLRSSESARNCSGDTSPEARRRWWLSRLRTFSHGMVSHLFPGKSGSLSHDLPGVSRFRDSISARSAVNLNESFELF